MPDMTDGPLDELYREVILDHYRSPRNRGRVEGPEATGVELQNPTCGDEIHLTLAVRHGHIADVRFEGRGCSISMASASMLTEALRGKTPEEALALSQAFKGMLHGTASADDEALGDLAALSGVAQFPVRVKCATLAWNALQRALGAAGAED